MNRIIKRIISISDESPHDISNGYILRVSKLLVAAGSREDIDVHCIAPVTHEIIEKAQIWADSKNVRLHGVSLQKEMLWNKKLRALFKIESSEILSNIATEDSLVVIHGINSIIEFANLKINGHLVADLIDETSPHMIRNLARKLLRGQLVEFVQTMKYLHNYFSKLKQLVVRYDNIIVVAHDDAHRMEKILPGKRISVLPNGVDIPSRSKIYSTEKNPHVIFQIGRAHV